MKDSEIIMELYRVRSPEKRALVERYLAKEITVKEMIAEAKKLLEAK